MRNKKEKDKFGPIDLTQVRWDMSKSGPTCVTPPAIYEFSLNHYEIP